MKLVEIRLILFILSIFLVDAKAWQVEVLAMNKVGISGASTNNYGGFFMCLDKTRPDLVIGGNAVTFGDDCLLAADPTWPSSDLFLQANDDIILEIDKNSNGEPAKFEIKNGANQTIYGLTDNGLATQTGSQAAIELKSTNNGNGSVLTLKNETPGLFNYVGAINFNTISSTPGQIAYSSSNTLDFRVNSISPLMQLSNGANHIIMSNGAKLTSGGMWMDVSSEAKKDLEKQVQVKEVLTALTYLPIYQWRYKEEPGSLHIGPTSEEFRQIFGLGPDDQSLSPSDLAAVAIAAVQALREENKILREELMAMEDAFMELKTVYLSKKRRKKLLKLK
ncbi:MAG: hypothetical protein KDC80_02775 [Saprospiraceae bacterium]|nr:hypothetical protein [Saprospiraceae bacterium]